MLSPQESWNSLRLNLPVTDVLNSKLLILRGDNSTVLIVRGCANVMFIFIFINLYSTGAVGVRGTIERLELAVAEHFDISVFACAFGFWHVGIDQFAVLAVDFEIKECV